MQAGSKIAIVGGGVTGPVLATRLCRRRGRNPGLEVVFVDLGFAPVWRPMGHAFARGFHQRILQAAAQGRPPGQRIRVAP